MRKMLTVGYLAFLGVIISPNVFAKDAPSDTKVADKGLRQNENGIMTANYVRSIKQKKYDQAIEKFDRAIRSEKEIEVKSVNFLKFDDKIGEIFIPNPDVADINMLSANTLYLNGIAPGVTALVINDKEGKVLADYVIRVTYPINDIRKAIEKVFPNLNIELITIDNNLLVKGSVASPEMAQEVIGIVQKFVEENKLINKLNIQTSTQVLLKVKVAEVNRGITKKLGVSWRTLHMPVTDKSTGVGLIGMATGNTSGLPEYSDSAGDMLKNTLKGLTGELKGGRWIIGSGINNIAALIDASTSEDFATILAEPTLVALSGQAAKFQSGGQQGYEVTQQGTDNKTVEFKDWGTIIEFTPVVLSEDRINIKVSAEVSSVSFEEKRPVVTKKSVETVIELGSGQSLALAGLLQKDKNTIKTETPFLADIPILGSLFRSSEMSLKEREVVIIVTPYIVNPSSKELKTPVDMIPKMLSPLKVLTQRRFTEAEGDADSSGFSLK